MEKQLAEKGIRLIPSAINAKTAGPKVGIGSKGDW